MEITCPKCAYKRVVPEGKIPATAEVATCPKCKARFKFRDVKSHATPVVPPYLAEEKPAAPAAPRQRQEADARSQQEAPAVPPQQTESAAHSQQPAEQNSAAPEDMTPEAPPSVSPPTAPQSEPSGKDDFWDKLETMGSQNGQDGQERQTDWARGGARSEVPWEELETFGFFQGLFQTVKQVMLSPIEFFKNMPIRGGISRPLIFYLLISEIVAVFTFIFQMMGMAALTNMGTGQDIDGTGLFAAVGVGGSAMVLVLYPILFTIGLFINSAISHFFLMIFKAADSGYEATFRVSAYGNAPIILAIIPLVGPFVGTFWALFVLIIGFKYVHRAGYGQVIMAFVTPLLLLFALIVVAAVAVPYMAQG